MSMRPQAKEKSDTAPSVASTSSLRPSERNRFMQFRSKDLEAGAGRRGVAAMQGEPTGERPRSLDCESCIWTWIRTPARIVA